MVARLAVGLHAQLAGRQVVRLAVGLVARLVVRQVALRALASGLVLVVPRVQRYLVLWMFEKKNKYQILNIISSQ